MAGTRMLELKDLVTGELARRLPAGRDPQWLEQMVDAPRFGWDWDALERGFFQPLHAWSQLHGERLRPVLAGLLIEALGHDAAPHAGVLATLEVEYLAAIMLDDLRNGRDLHASTTSAVSVPLPTWVTIAYNARQLVPVMIARQDSALAPASRAWLAQRFSQFLFQQGVASALDLWCSEQAWKHDSEDDFVAHLRLYIGTMSFGLACDVASAAAGLDEQRAEGLRQAGVELGVALRLAALAKGCERTLGAQSQEPLIRWRHGVAPERLAPLAHRAFRRSLDMAHAYDARVAAMLRAFATTVEPTFAAGSH